MWRLLACGNPISNDALLADGEFLIALPSDERLESPIATRDLAGAEASVADAAALAAAELDAWTATARAAADALRDTQPDERTDVLRRWDAVPAATGTTLFWVSAEIVRAEAGATVGWTLSTAETDDGPWIPVGAGTHEPSGSGTFDWALPGPALDALAVDYADAGGPEGGRAVEILGSSLGVPVRAWALVDTATVGWTGPLAVTADGAAWPGSAVAVMFGDRGGRAEGEVDAGGTPVAFSACWDVGGDLTYQGGDPEVAASGVPGNCTVPEIGTP